MAKGQETSAAAGATVDDFKINDVGLDRPWFWLACGWQDLRAAPAVSIGYGLLFVVAGLVLALLFHLAGSFFMIMPLAAGFMLMAPILAVGLYEISRQLADGKTITFATPLHAWRHNIGQIALLGLALTIFMLAWNRIATLLFALFFADTPAEMGDFVVELFTTVNGIGFLFVGTAIGAVLATLVFGIAAISVPMLLDQNVNTMTAIAVSLKAVSQNQRTMIVWAGLIALFTIAGLTTFFIGLAVTLPLIGHATWYAYKDLVVPVHAPAAARPKKKAKEA